MAIYVGSARLDESGKITGGKAGDQKQTKKPDYTGEVSLQTMYTHSKGWYILRAIDRAHSAKLANRMEAACNNSNLGYDQNQRLGVITNGIDTKVATECDCSSLVRQCVKEATGIDPGNFTTGNEATVLGKTGLFEKKVAYVDQKTTPVYDGDILVTKTKGHTVIVTSGNPRPGAAPTKTTEEVAKEVISGKWGSGTDRKNKLEAAGYNYDEVQKKVNELLKQPTASATVKATVNTSGSNLTLRNASGTALTTIPNKTVVTVLKKNAKKMTIKGETFDMTQIRYGKIEGYSATKYLAF